MSSDKGERLIVDVTDSLGPLISRGAGEFVRLIQERIVSRLTLVYVQRHGAELLSRIDADAAVCEAASKIAETLAAATSRELWEGELLALRGRVATLEETLRELGYDISEDADIVPRTDGPEDAEL